MFHYFSVSPKKPTAVDPAGPSSGSDRVNRGGSWFSNAGAWRSADRGKGAPGKRRDYLGFRPRAAAPPTPPSAAHAVVRCLSSGPGLPGGTVSASSCLPGVQSRRCCGKIVFEFPIHWLFVEDLASTPSGSGSDAALLGRPAWLPGKPRRSPRWNDANFCNRPASAQPLRP
jgi:hypothetical protein